MSDHDASSRNGWNEYSRLVLKELETLADGIESLALEIQTLKQEIAKMQVREDKVDELKLWKEKMDNVATPAQLKAAMIQIESLKVFKVKAVTVFAAVQFSMAALALVLKFLS